LGPVSAIFSERFTETLGTGARLTKSLRTGPMSDISSSQVRHKFGPKFDLRQI